MAVCVLGACGDSHTGGSAGVPAPAGGGDDGGAAGVSGAVAGEPATTGGAPSAGPGTGGWSCLEPMALDGGFVACQVEVAGFLYEAFRHRAVAGECPNSVPRPEPTPSGSFPELNECESDADCSDLPYGHCTWPDPYAAKSCSAGCVADADCADDEACLCRDPVGICIPAGCRVDSDCGEGGLCATYGRGHGCGVIPVTGMACRQPDDTCLAHQDCQNIAEYVNGACTYDVDADHRACEPAGGGCGG